MISILLIKKIASLFLVMMGGFLLVKLGILKTEDSTVLSRLSVYLIYPANLLSYFCKEADDTVKQGLLLAFASAFCISVLYAVLSRILRVLLKGNAVEELSFCYPNAGNLIVPIVISVLGSEWVIYCAAYIAVFHLFIWSHGMRVMKSDERFSLRTLLLNVNLIALAIGLVMLFTGLRPPAVIADAFNDLSPLVGPMGMLITGMLIAAADWKSLLSNKRIYLVIFVRMILLPFIVLLIMKFTEVRSITPNAYMIFLVSFLAASAPCASTVVQMAILYDKDAVYASAINIVTTLCAIVTMPFMVFLYETI